MSREMKAFCQIETEKGKEKQSMLACTLFRNITIKIILKINQTIKFYKKFNAIACIADFELKLDEELRIVHLIITL